MGRKRDRFWEYAQELGAGRFKCTFCLQEFSGGASRIKAHLASIPGRDISICKQVPQQVREEAREAIGFPNKKVKEMPSSGNKTASASNALHHLHVINPELPGDREKVAVDKWVIRNLDLKTYVRDVKKFWVTTGCTLVLSLRRDKKRGDIVDVNACSHKGEVFMNSFEIQNKSKEELETIFCSVIEKIGPDHVVQLMTNAIELESIGDVLVHKHPRMFWTRCAGQGIQLLLKHICDQVSWVQNVIGQAFLVVEHMHKDRNILSIMRKYTDRELNRPCKTRFSSVFDMLQSVFDVKNELQLLFASSTLLNLCCGEVAMSKQLTRIIGNAEFWSESQEVLQIFRPILGALQLAESEGSTFGYLYQAMDKAKEEIRQQCGNNQEKYMPIMEVFEGKHWSYIIHPTHAAAAFLNPSYMSGENFHLDSKMKDGIAFILENLLTVEEQEQFTEELHVYREKVSSLFTKQAKAMLKRTHPYEWWEQFGNLVPTLRKYSIRILSQPCSSVVSSLHEQN